MIRPTLSPSITSARALPAASVLRHETQLTVARPCCRQRPRPKVGQHWHRLHALQHADHRLRTHISQSEPCSARSAGAARPWLLASVRRPHPLPPRGFGRWSTKSSTGGRATSAAASTKTRSKRRRRQARATSASSASSSRRTRTRMLSRTRGPPTSSARRAARCPRRCLSQGRVHRSGPTMVAMAVGDPTNSTCAPDQRFSVTAREWTIFAVAAVTTSGRRRWPSENPDRQQPGCRP